MFAIPYARRTTTTVRMHVRMKMSGVPVAELVCWYYSESVIWLTEDVVAVVVVVGVDVVVGFDAGMLFSANKIVI